MATVRAELRVNDKGQELWYEGELWGEFNGRTGWVLDYDLKRHDVSSKRVWDAGVRTHGAQPQPMQRKAPSKPRARRSAEPEPIATTSTLLEAIKAHEVECLGHTEHNEAWIVYQHLEDTLAQFGLTLLAAQYYDIVHVVDRHPGQPRMGKALDGEWRMLKVEVLREPPFPNPTYDAFEKWLKDNHWVEKRGDGVFINDGYHGYRWVLDRAAETASWEAIRGGKWVRIYEYAASALASPGKELPGVAAPAEPPNAISIAELKRRVIPGTKLRLTHWGYDDLNKPVEVVQVSSVWFVIMGAEPNKRTFVLWPKGGATDAGFSGVEQDRKPGSGTMRFEFAPATSERPRSERMSALAVLPRRTSLTQRDQRKASEVLHRWAQDPSFVFTDHGGDKASDPVEATYALRAYWASIGGFIIEDGASPFCRERWSLPGDPSGTTRIIRCTRSKPLAPRGIGRIQGVLISTESGENRTVEPATEALKRVLRRRLNILDPDAFEKLTELEGASWAAEERGHADEPGRFLDAQDAYRILKEAGLADTHDLAEVADSPGFVGAQGEIYVIERNGDIALFADTASASKAKAAARVLRVINSPASPESQSRFWERIEHGAPFSQTIENAWHDRLFLAIARRYPDMPTGDATALAEMYDRIMDSVADEDERRKFERKIDRYAQSKNLTPRDEWGMATWEHRPVEQYLRALTIEQLKGQPKIFSVIITRNNAFVVDDNFRQWPLHNTADPQRQWKRPLQTNQGKFVWTKDGWKLEKSLQGTERKGTKS